MAIERIPFDDLPWTQGAHPLERKRAGRLGGAVLLEFRPGFADPNRCANGHAGIVLAGRLGFRLDDGSDLIVGPGEGFVVDPGDGHRAFVVGDEAVRLFIAPRSAPPLAPPLPPV